jgi:hypothetical protein
MRTKHHIGGIMNKQYQSLLFEKVVTYKNLVFEICYIVLSNRERRHPPFLLSFLRLICTNNIVQSFRSRTRCVYPLENIEQALYPLFVMVDDNISSTWIERR